MVKFDRENHTREVHELGRNRFCGEFVFCPRVESASEDDGYCVGFLHDEEGGRSELLILDAQDFSGAPVARLIMPARIPYGFHAYWVGGDAIANQACKLTGD